MNRKTKDIILVGFALFSMFLGAGNLIFPPYLGLHSGEGWLPVLLGFVITGVGLPFLGIYAIARSGGSILTLSRYVGQPFAKLLGIVVALSIGPMFAIPRTAATTHEVGVMAVFPEANNTVTSVVFFSLVLLFSINHSRVMDYLSKVLSPFLILTLFALVIAAFVHPIGTPGIPVDPSYNFAGGFTEGYQTMDGLAATLFAGAALSGIVARGYERREEQLKMVIYCGVIATALLALVYLGLTFGGAGATDIVPAEIERTTLLREVARGLLGSFGGYCLSLAVSLACLTTSVGLTCSCGEFFCTVSNGRLQYTQVAILIVLVSAAISILGVTAIINLAVPFLYLVYPVLMALVLCNCFDPLLHNKNAYIGAVLGSFGMGLLDAAETLGSFGLSENVISAISNFKAIIPLSSFGLAWVIPTLFFIVIFSFIPRKQSDTPYEFIVFDEKAGK